MAQSVYISLEYGFETLRSSDLVFNIQWGHKLSSGIISRPPFDIRPAS